jgi:hypothetical protein
LRWAAIDPVAEEAASAVLLQAFYPIPSERLE